MRRMLRKGCSGAALPATFITLSARDNALTCRTRLEHCSHNGAREDKTIMSGLLRIDCTRHWCTNGAWATSCTQKSNHRVLKRTWTTIRYSSHVACHRCSSSGTRCRLASPAAGSPVVPADAAAETAACSRRLMSAMIEYRQFWG